MMRAANINFSNTGNPLLWNSAGAGHGMGFIRSSATKSHVMWSFLISRDIRVNMKFLNKPF